MKHLARALTALGLLSLAAPALPCGFDKTQTTTSTTPSPAPTTTTAKGEKAKGAKNAKTEKAKAPARTDRVTAASY